MAGLFPPSGAQIWKENFNWQPIPIHSVPKNQDNLMAVEKPCDRYDYVMIEWQKTTEYTDLFVKYEQFIEYLEENSGAKLTSLASIAMLYGTFETEVANGYRCVKFSIILYNINTKFKYFPILAVCHCGLNKSGNLVVTWNILLYVLMQCGQPHPK